MEKLNIITAEMAEKNIEMLGQMFPNCLTEKKNDDGKIVKAIDFDKLRQELADSVVEGPEERYQFTWPDKRNAIRLANAPTTKTLRPCREESVDFDNTQNLYIEGDNLDVLKILRENYLGKIKMIYIDPPYNIGNDFVYNDDFSQTSSEYISESGQFDSEGNRLVMNTESNGRFHTDWLNMMYPRLKVAKDLLTDSGLIFISIDDHEVRNILNLCDEIFGKDKFLACFPRITKKAGKTSEAIAKNHDYVVAYCKTDNPVIYLQHHTDEGFKFSDEYVATRGKYKLNQTLDYDSLSYSASLDYPIQINGITLYPGSSYEAYLERKKGNYARADWAWRWSKDLFDYGYKNGFIVLKKSNDGYRIYTKTYQNAKIERTKKGFEVVSFDRTKAISSLEFTQNEFSNDNSKKNIVQLFGKGVFDYSKPVSLLYRLIQYSTSTQDIILDFFSGSSTTAHSVMQINADDGGRRKYIMVQLPEITDEKSEAFKAGYKNICEIGKERIRRAGQKILTEVLSGRGCLDGTGYGVGIDNYEEYVKATGDRVLDIGFRVLKLDSANEKEVKRTPSEVPVEQGLFDAMLDDMVENIKEDRTPEDLLFQVLPMCNLPLSCKIETKEIDGKCVFIVEDGYLIACFDNNINETVITEIAKMKPYYFVMRDSSLATDNVADNFDQIFNAYSKDTIRRIL